MTCNFIEKETPAQAFSREYCKTFKNTFLKKISGQPLLRFSKLETKPQD